MMGDEDNMLYNMLLCCSISVDVEVMFVQHLLGKNVIQNKLIPNTSCLWRQEEVTVTILRLWIRV